MNTVYDKEKDNLYIAIYRIGEGLHGIWFAIELVDFVFNIKRRKVDIKYKVIKMYDEDDIEQYETEININKKLVLNKKKSKNINYPLHYFKIDDKMVILYEVAYCSLESCSEFKKYDEDLYEKFMMKIIPQMIESMNFVHECGFIHRDIKPENYLLCGINELQNNIFEYAKQYKLETKFSSKIKQKDLEKMIKKPIEQFCENIFKKFDLPDITNVSLFDNDTEESSSTYDSSDESDNESDENDIESDLVSNMSEDSHGSSPDGNDYCKFHDKFHTKYIFNNIFKQNKSNNDLNKSSDLDDEKLQKEKKQKKEKKFDHIKKYFENPEIKLTDFEYLMCKKSNERNTMQNRGNRSPEIILGLKYTYKSDYWAFGSSIYELMSNDYLIDIKNDDDYKIYDNDLINIKQLIAKFKNYDEFIQLIQKSPRKDYLITNTNILKFIKKINYNYWIDDIKKTSFIITNLIKNALIINDEKRSIIFDY
jgi:serine/threonine protein kinase